MGLDLKAGDEPRWAHQLQLPLLRVDVAAAKASHWMRPAADALT
jgi:hypothetical protein